MMKSSGLSTEPWWTPTFTSNSSLYPSPTWTWLRALAYILCTSCTIHFSTPSFSAPTRWPSEALGQTPSPGLQKPCRVSCWHVESLVAVQKFSVIHFCQVASTYSLDMFSISYPCWLVFIVCLFVLRFYGPVNSMGSCRARSVYLTTRLLGRLSPLSG